MWVFQQWREGEGEGERVERGWERGG